MSIFNTKDLPALKTINNAAKELGLEQHILRFWESRFPQISPIKSKGNRRLYRQEDMDMLHRIKDLLYNQGYTIEGARKHLESDNIVKETDQSDKAIHLIVKQLADLRKRLRSMLDD